MIQVWTNPFWWLGIVFTIAMSFPRQLEAGNIIGFIFWQIVVFIIFSGLSAWIMMKSDDDVEGHDKKNV